MIDPPSRARAQLLQSDDIFGKFTLRFTVFRDARQPRAYPMIERAARGLRSSQNK